MALITLTRAEPGDDSHLHNSIEYVSDGRKVMIGGNGVNYMNTAQAEHQMEYVQQYYGKTRFCPVLHFVVDYQKNTLDVERACEYTRQVADFFKDNYQTLYCVHERDASCDDLHAHILVNPVNLQDGRVMQTDTDSMKPFCNHVARVTGENNRIKFNYDN